MAVESRLLKYVKSEESYRPGSVIIREGAHGDWAYVVLEGRVKVQKKTPKGTVTLATLPNGAIFGELIFLQMEEGKRTASIVADGPVTAGLLDMELLAREFRAVSPLLKVLLSNLARRLQGSTDQLVSLLMKERLP
jgi:CRP-like cAMP-binding protein